MANKRPNTFLTGYDLTETIFHSLYSQKPSQDYESLSIILPDTVIFRNGKPIVWYYSDSNGTLNQSKNTEMGINNILSKFLENKSTCDPVACLMKPLQGISKSDEKENSNRVSVEYFDEKGLRQFLKNSANLEKGILQKFINPREEKNNCIEAVWEKGVCIVSKKINCKSLKDANVNINEKCVTYEGPDYLSDKVQIDGNILATRIKTSMNAIVKYLSKVTFEECELTKLVNYFKVGHNNEVWYLWTTFASVIQTASESASLSFKTKTQSDSGKNDLKRCSNCNKNFAQAQMVNVNYKTLIEKAKGFLSSVRSYKDYGDNSARNKLLNASKSSRDSYRSKSKEDLLDILKLIHPTFNFKDLENLSQDPSLAIKKVQMCYSCYMTLFNASPRIPNPVSFRKVKEQTQTSKTHRSSASFVLKSVNKSTDTSQITNSLYLKKNSSQEKNSSSERLQQSQRKDTGVLRSSLSPKKSRKESNFYLKPSSSHRRQQSSSLLSTRLEKSSSRSIGNYILTTERNESVGRESLDFTRLSATPVGKGNQTSFSRDEKSSFNGSKSLVRIRRVRLISQDSKIQDMSESGSISNLYVSSSYEKGPNTKSQALMMQLKQVSGSQTQARVSERSTLDGSKDISRTSFQNTSLIPRNGSPVSISQSSSKKKVALTLRRDKNTSDKALKLTRTGTGGMTHSKVLSVEETTKLKNAIRHAVNTKDQSSNPRQATASEKNFLLTLGRVQSVSSFNPKKTESQSSRDRRMASCSLSVKPQAENDPKVRVIPRPTVQFTITNSIETATKGSEISGPDEDYWPSVQKKDPSDATFNICNDINRGIDFIKNKTFTRNTSWVSKKGETSIDKRSHKKSSSMSIFALASNTSLTAKSSQDKIVNPTPEINNNASKPVIAPIARLSIQKVCLDDATQKVLLEDATSVKPSKLNQSPDISPTYQKETIDSEGEQFKSKATVTATNDQPVQSQNSFKEFPLSPSVDMKLSETFEACLLDNKDNFHTLEVSESNESEEGLDKAFVGGEEESDIALNQEAKLKGLDLDWKSANPNYSSLKREQRMFSNLLEDSDLKSIGIPSSQKIDTRNALTEKEEAVSVKGFTFDLSSSKDFFNNRKRICILRKTNVIGNRSSSTGESFREKKVSFKEQVEEITIEQIQQLKTMEEEEGEEEELHLQAVQPGEERLTTDFSDDQEDLEEWPEENFENFFNARSQGSEIIGQ